VYFTALESKIEKDLVYAQHVHQRHHAVGAPDVHVQRVWFFSRHSGLITASMYI
jgi:hypothetical protein